MDAAKRALLKGIDDERALARHGFDGWPGGEELARRAMEHDDALVALASHMGLKFQVDSRGRVSLIPRGGEDSVV